MGRLARLSFVLFAAVPPHCNPHMQWMFFGYGTNWHPAYYPSLIISALTSFTALYSLRYRLAVWEAFSLVKLHGFIGTCAIFVELFLPLPGYLDNGWLGYIPFQNPTANMALLYFSVRNCLHLTLGSCDALQCLALYVEASAPPSPASTICRLQLS